VFSDEDKVFIKICICYKAMDPWNNDDRQSWEKQEKAWLRWAIEDALWNRVDWPM